MSVVYRAIWQSERPHDVGAALDQFREATAAWAGSSSAPSDRALTVVPREDHVRGLDVVCRDPANAQGAEWKTTIRTAIDDVCQHFLVENQVESDDVTLRIAVGRPRIVDDLLAGSANHWLGSSGILTGVEAIPASLVPVLLEQLRSDDRTLPYIVFSEPPDFATYDWLRVADLTARRATGVANVVTLDHDAVTVFKRDLGDLAVWGGGIRTYVPAPLDDARSFQHRYIPARHCVISPANRIADRLVLAVSQLSSRRRLPEVFATLVGGTGPDATLPEMLDLALEENAQLEFTLAAVQADYDDTERELARARGHIGRLRDVLASLGQLGSYWGSATATLADALPDEVESVGEAFLLAQLHLGSDLSIPDSAGVDHDRLDTAPNASAWGNTTWRGLRALAAYVRDRRDGFGGDFWAWCKEGRPDGWPATSKKLTMVESDSVRNNPKFRDARNLRVQTVLDAAGTRYMESHLKIAEGGGDLAPRVYFYDDTSGATGKVHIGLVGPHYLVPNTKS